VTCASPTAVLLRHTQQLTAAAIIPVFTLLQAELAASPKSLGMQEAKMLVWRITFTYSPLHSLLLAVMLRMQRLQAELAASRKSL
jgi:hypothetical protein